MDIRFIERLVELVETSTLAELEYSEGDARIRLVKTAGGVAESSAPLTATATPGPSHAESIAEMLSTAEAVPLMAESAPTHFIVAGIVGTFFRAASPADQPLCAIDDDVEEGQTLGLIEAMKTFNPVEADRAGRIIAVLCEDGAPVEPGTLLFEIVPHDPVFA